jgi:hypothetical protein
MYLGNSNKLSLWFFTIFLFRALAVGTIYKTMLLNCLHYKHKRVTRCSVEDCRYERYLWHTKLTAMDSRHNVAFYRQSSRQNIKECKTCHMTWDLMEFFRIVTCCMTLDTWNTFFRIVPQSVMRKSFYNIPLPQQPDKYNPNENLEQGFA